MKEVVPATAIIDLKMNYNNKKKTTIGDNQSGIQTSTHAA